MRAEGGLGHQGQAVVTGSGDPYTLRTDEPLYYRSPFS
jgi:hypothetical protein